MAAIGSDVTKVLAGRKSSLLYDEIINAAATRTLWTLNADGISTDFNHLMFANRQLVQKGFIAIMTLKTRVGSPPQRSTLLDRWKYFCIVQYKNIYKYFISF